MSVRFQKLMLRSILEQHHARATPLIGLPQSPAAQV